MSDAYIGVPFINQVSSQFPKEDFVGSDFGSVTGAYATYTYAVELSVDVPGSNTENILVVYDNIVQEPDTAYTIHEDSSNRPRILSFDEQPDSSAVIYVIHRGISLTLLMNSLEMVLLLRLPYQRPLTVRLHS